jgi:hypothetical protein
LHLQTWKLAAVTEPAYFKVVVSRIAEHVQANPSRRTIPCPNAAQPRPDAKLCTEV